MSNFINAWKERMFRFIHIWKQNKLIMSFLVLTMLFVVFAFIDLMFAVFGNPLLEGTADWFYPFMNVIMLVFISFQWKNYLKHSKRFEISQNEFYERYERDKEKGYIPEGFPHISEVVPRMNFKKDRRQMAFLYLAAIGANLFSLYIQAVRLF